MGKMIRLSLLAIFVAGCVTAETTALAVKPVPGEKKVGAAPFSNPGIFFHADGSPDYPAYYRQRYQYMADQLFRLEDDPKIRKANEIALGDVAAALAWLGRQKGGDCYLDRAHDVFGILLDYADGNPVVTHDCFGFPSLLQAAVMLKEQGRLDANWEPVLHRITLDGVGFIDAHFPVGSGNQGLDGNQSLARMYGLLLAQKLYPEMPLAAVAAGKVKTAFETILASGDICSDSRNYFEVSYPYFILIAHELGRETDLAASAGFKRMFANIRDAVSPNGLLPEFGSGYFSANRYPNTPLILEYAAALYKDSSFSAAARRYYGMLIQSGPNDPANIRDAVHGSSYLMAQIIDLCPLASGPVQQAEFISGVTFRNAHIGGEKPGFVILRPSVSPGAPMILMDVLGQGDHCQPEFTASIAYYESDHVPLFYQYGRYISGASRGNQVFFGQAGAQDPDPEWPADTWRTVVVPSERFIGDDGEARIEKVSIRTDSRTKSKEKGLTFENLRLSGTGGSMPVCDLASAEWRGNTTSVATGIKPGSKAISIFDDGNGTYARGFTPLVFDPEKYQALLCDVKWFGKSRPSAQIRVTTDNRSWMPVEQTALVAGLKDATVERRGGDCRARLVYSRYGTFDSSLVRQIVLTKEGVLAVRDDILPGQTAGGLPAFTLWQMYSIDSEGPNRFTSRGECVWPSCDRSDTNLYRRGMSVFFSGPDGTVAGKQVVPDGRLRNYRDIQRDLDLRTAYARLPMQAGKDCYLNLLVVPHSPDADLSALDGATATVHDAKSTVFKTACDGVSLAVTIGRDGQWQVVR